MFGDLFPWGFWLLVGCWTSVCCGCWSVACGGFELLLLLPVLTLLLLSLLLFWLAGVGASVCMLAGVGFFSGSFSELLLMLPGTFGLPIFSGLLLELPTTGLPSTIRGKVLFVSDCGLGLSLGAGTTGWAF